MRLYLDTNILVFLMYDTDELCADVKECIYDYSNTLATCSVCVQELVHLIQIGKVRIAGYRDTCDAARSALQRIHEIGVDIIPITNTHMEALIGLPLYDDHRDPNDRMVIAQAIADRASLVSSDRKFSRYKRYGLNFLYNER